MKAWLTILFVLLPAMLRAHVGSPNVFFDGKAGAYSVRVVIRPPVALPGRAQIDVRVSDPGVTGIRVLPVFTGGAAPGDTAPVEATATPGEAGLYSATFWLLVRGSYAVRVSVEGPQGSGFAIVPLQAAALQNPVMPAGLLATLVALGVVLLAGAIWIARAGAREATLPAEVEATATDFARGRRATWIAVAVLGTTLGLGFARWQKMDRDFRQKAVARPVPVEATVRTEAAQNFLRLVPVPENAPTTAWDTLVTDHGKLMHLFLVREAGDGLGAFAHLHPVRRDQATFEGVVPPLPGGNYWVYGELTYEDGRNETLVSRVLLPESAGPARQAGWTMTNDIWCQSPLLVTGNGAAPTALDYDDSWHVNPAATPLDSRISTLMGGRRMIFQTPGELIANRESLLRFTVLEPGGESVPLQPYMGMLGHAVVRREDGAVFAHLHPAGTISMAAQQVMTRAADATSAGPMAVEAGAREVAFPYAFPQAGDYRIWVQVRIGGRVLTGVFEVRVKDGP